MSAVLFGSISTIADTSELQRAAFNEAFAAHDLGWVWEREDYIDRLASSGGRNRVADYASSIGQHVDADAVHATKSRIYQQKLATANLTTRPGVTETIAAAKRDGQRVALVTTTSHENVTALLEAVAAQLDADEFDLIVDSSSVDEPKPDKAAYVFALDALSESADDCIAIEDNVGGVQAAVAAGLDCIAFPNENTSGHNFDGARSVVDELDPSQVTQLAAGA